MFKWNTLSNATAAFIVLVAVAMLAPSGVVGAAADDWPMWRHDAGHTAATEQELPAALHLQWKRSLPRPTPTFPKDPRMCFDKSYEPVAAGKQIFVPSMVTDSVTALDAAMGEERWTFFADGPVRFAPVVWENKVYFVADDGFLYCVGAQDGRLLWKYSPLGPERAANTLLGDERLICRWPARGGPVLADGTVYFGVGIFPFEGVAVCAVDANTGKALWVNKDGGWLKDALLDHSDRRDCGLSPQGYLAVLGSKLIVPCGRALPAFFDRATGRMDPYTTGWGGRIALAKGSWSVCGVGDWLFQSGDLYRLKTGASEAPPKPGDYVSVEDFARQMRTSPATVEKWIKQYKIETATQDSVRCLRVRNDDATTFLAWSTFSKREPIRAGEQQSLETRTRLEIDPANAKELAVAREPVVTEKAMYYSRPVTQRVSLVRDSNEDRVLPRPASFTEIVACDLAGPTRWEPTLQGRLGGRMVAWSSARFNELWTLPSSLKVHIKAGRRLYAGGPGTVAAVDIPDDGQAPKVSWRATITGTPNRMLAANGKLFVVTVEGSLYCFGADKVSPRSYAVATDRPASSKDAWTARVAEILQQTGVREGYGIALGLGTGRLVEEMARQSKLRMIVLEPDAGKVASARRGLHKLGLYGSRIHVLPGDLSSLRLAPFLASVVVAEESPPKALETNSEFAKRLFALLRPYGGTACFKLTASEGDAFARRIQAAALTGAEVKRADGLSVLTRRGALPGAADWAHESGEAAHTYASQDQSVASPLGVLWFGGGLDRTIPWIEGDPPRLPGEDTGALAYAGAGPRPRVAGGRMFVQVGDVLYAADIYTGRHLWKQTLKSLGDFAAAEDSVYALTGGNCLRLDAATGKQLAAFGGAAGAAWRQIRIGGDSLVGAAGKSLVCLDRRSGALRWKRSSQRDGFGFALGPDRVFCVDYWLPAHRKKDDSQTEEAEIAALKLANGEQLWRITAAVPALAAASKFAKFAPPLPPQLAFSEPADVLLFTRNTATAAAYRGATGGLLWSKELPCKDPPTSFSSYHPPVVLADRLIAHGGMPIDLATGEPMGARMWKGANVDFRGCGRALGCLRLILVRDAHASYFDLSTGAHTYLRGIRSGCTNSLIPADGVLSAPNYSRHCNCNYPLSLSLAFVTMPEASAWESRAADGSR